MIPFYEEKLFATDTWFRTSPGGAWSKKSGEPKVRNRKIRKRSTDTPIDCLLEAVRLQLDIPKIGTLLELLQIEASSVSRIRRGKLPITANVILRIYDCTTFSMEEIRELADLPNPRAIQQPATEGIST